MIQTTFTARLAVGSIPLLVGLLWASGCATSSESGPPPEVRALEAGKETVRRASREGRAVSDEQEAYTLRVRHNPPSCDAPPTEVYAHGKWTRVYLTAGEVDEEELDDLESGPITEPKLRIVGTWDGEREAETGLSYPVLEVGEIQTP